MFRNILKYGLIAGVIAGGFLSAVTVTFHDQMLMGNTGMVIGYASMLVALSAVFLGIKRQRDVEGGGVIRFWPAFGMGLAISLVAAVLYALSWELAVKITGLDFASAWATHVIGEAQQRGDSAAKIAELTKQMADFKVMYANPLMRIPMTMSEILPVGVLVSLVSAGLLRKPEFMAARR